MGAQFLQELVIHLRVYSQYHIPIIIRRHTRFVETQGGRKQKFSLRLESSAQCEWSSVSQ